MTSANRQQPEGGRRRWAELDSLREIGVYIVIGMFFGVIVVTRVAASIIVGSNLAEALASFVLLAATFVYLALWGWSTRKELGMLEEVGGDSIPPLPGSTFPLVLAAGVFLGALGAATAFPLAFALLYAGAKVVEAFGYIGIRRTIVEGAAAVRATPIDADRERAVEALEHYYLGRPWHRLQAAGVLVAAVGGALAIAAVITPDAAYVVALNVAAYLVLAFAIVMNEAVVASWRVARQAELPTEYR